MRRYAEGSPLARSHFWFNGAPSPRLALEDLDRRELEGRADLVAEGDDLLRAPAMRDLRLHCYRMLGSSHDSDDMVQETLVRAFRAQHTLQDPATARAWLHRIATNVCIDELARRL